MQPPPSAARSATADWSSTEVTPPAPADAGLGASPPSRPFFRPGPGWFDIEGRKVGRERAAVDAAQRVLVAALPTAEASATSRAESSGTRAVPSAGSSAFAAARSETPADVAGGQKLYFRSSPGWFDRKAGRYRAALSARERRLAADAAAPSPTGAAASPAGADATAPVAPPAPPVHKSPATKAPSLSTPPSTLAPAVARAGQSDVAETARLSADKPSSTSTTAASVASFPAKRAGQEAPSAAILAREASPTPAPGNTAPTLASERSAAAPSRLVAPDSSPESESPASLPVAATPPAQTSDLSSPAPATPVAAPAGRPPASEPSSAPVPVTPRAAAQPPSSQDLPEAAVPAPVSAVASPPAPAAPESVPPAATASAGDARPASLDAPREGRADDLKLIKGIGPKNEASCHALGVYHIEQIALWSAANAAWVGHHIAFPGRIEREAWIDQAKLLSIGVDTPHAAGVRAGTIVVDAAADAPLSDADVAALAAAMPALTPTVANEHLHPGARPVGLVAARGNAPDDLQRIRGIGPQNETRLQALGIWHFAQIAAWTPDHVRWVGSYLAFPGRIAREAWITQAAALAAGGSSTAPKPRGRQRG